MLPKQSDLQLTAWPRVSLRYDGETSQRVLRRRCGGGHCTARGPGADAQDRTRVCLTDRNTRVHGFQAAFSPQFSVAERGPHLKSQRSAPRGVLSPTATLWCVLQLVAYRVHEIPSMSIVNVITYKNLRLHILIYALAHSYILV